MTSNIKQARSALFYTFLTNLDFLIILPLIPLFVEQGGGFNATKVASILSIRVGASLLGTILNPILFSKKSYGFALFIAALMKTIAFATLLFRNYEALVVFSLISGLGTGFLKPSIRAVIADSVAGETRKRYFQFFFVAMNLAYVVGPTLSNWIENLGYFKETILALALIEFCGGLTIYRNCKNMLGDSNKNSTAPKNIPLKDSIKESYRHGIPFIFTLDFINYLAMGFMVSSFVLYHQINPDLGNHRNFFLSYEGFALILCQFLLVPVFKKVSNRKILGMTSVLYTLGIATSFSPIFSITLLGLTFFSLAECLGLPQAQILITERCSEPHRKTVFSMLTLFATLGEILGSLLAGWIIDSSIGQGSPNQLIVPLAITCGLIFFLSSRQLSRKESPLEGKKTLKEALS